MCAIKTFRRTFNRVRREISKASGFGFAFPVKAEDMRQAFREEMAKARVPATADRVYLVERWVNRASRLGGAA